MPLAASACQDIAGVRDLTLSSAATSGAGGAGGACSGASSTSATSSAASGLCTPSFEHCATPADENCDGLGCVGAPVSSQRFGEGQDQDGRVVLSDGADVVLVGAATGMLPFEGISPMDPGDGGDPNTSDLVVVRFAAGVSAAWEHRFADTEVGGAAIASNGDTLIVGGLSVPEISSGAGEPGTTITTTSDAWVTRLGRDGQERWSHRWGDADDQAATTVTVDSAGNALITGLFGGVLELDPTHKLENHESRSMFVAKLDPLGAVLWSKAFGDSVEPLVPTAAAVDASGALVFVGYFVDPISFGGGTLESHGSGESAFIAKLDKDGNHVWSQAFGGAGATRAHAVGIDRGGAVFSAGRFSQGIALGGLSEGTSHDLGQSGFLVKLGKDGAPLWLRAQREPSGQKDAAVRSSVYGLAVDLDGNAVVIGDGNGTVVFDPQSPCESTRFGSGAGTSLLLAKYSGSGALLWAKLFGDSAHGNSVAIDPLGAVWATGYFEGNLDFGAPPVHTSHGGDDIFLAKLSP